MVKQRLWTCSKYKEFCHGQGRAWRYTKWRFCWTGTIQWVCKRWYCQHQRGDLLIKPKKRVWNASFHVGYLFLLIPWYRRLRGRPAFDDILGDSVFFLSPNYPLTLEAITLRLEERGSHFTKFNFSASLSTESIFALPRIDQKIGTNLSSKCHVAQ